MVSLKSKFFLFLLGLEIIFIVLFGIFVRYDSDLAYPHSFQPNRTLVMKANPSDNINFFSSFFYFKGPKNKTFMVQKLEQSPSGNHIEKFYSFFQDIHTMMFIGFGFLMTFLKRYGFSSIGLNFLIGAFVIQWDTLVHGFINYFDSESAEKLIRVHLIDLIKCDFSVAAVLISFGAVLGKVSPLQLMIMAFIEIVLYEGNQKIVFGLLGATDVGDSMVVHLFGAYFGLMVSRILYTEDVERSEDKESSVYQSDIFAMIGTCFLWICWPSFNAATAVEEGRLRAIINTYYSLTASVLMSFVFSSLVTKSFKFNMIHIQNATLAGGVAVGSIADFIIEPWAALIIGLIAGMISVIGYNFLTPILNKSLKFHDTCGVHNLHGIPGIISGLASILASYIADYYYYGDNYHHIFGDAASSSHKARMQMACLAISLGFSIVGGLITGLVLKIPIFEQPSDEQIFDDEDYWLIPVDASLHRAIQLQEININQSPLLNAQ